jgi:hypothetical protein
MPLQATSGAASYDAFGGGAAAVPNYIEEVFQTWLYTGNGSTQTITNGIDFSTKGGMMWLARRDSGFDPRIWDTVRGRAHSVATDLTAIQTTESAGVGLTSFNTDGFSVGPASSTAPNLNNASYVSWSFREQPKFYDVLTYTGDGTVSRNIAHNLGSEVGSIFLKRTSGAVSSWSVYHRSLGTGKLLQLNTTGAVLTDADTFASVTSTTFSVSNNTNQNDNGETYVAYLFAHNAGGFGLTGTDNVISCGTYSGTGAAKNITLGYEPQWVMVKRTDSTADWVIMDAMRTGFLEPNTSDAESGGSWFDLAGDNFFPTATGFQINTAGPAWNASGGTYIYIAIRRGPMKVPTVGTSVFSPVAQTNTGSQPFSVTAGFPVDSAWFGQRNGWGVNFITSDRLRGATNLLITTVTTSESVNNSTYGPSVSRLDSNTLFKDGMTNASEPNIYWNFRRAPSFFDEVCYTGNSTSGATQTHTLGVTPELMIVKGRSASGRWYVYDSTNGATKYMELDTTIASSAFSGIWNDTAPTSTQFTLGNYTQVNQSGESYIAYLFATCAGVSKVGSYTGNGSTQTINCGFGAGGARFVLIKRTDSTGGWYVYDTARGMTVLTDPYLFLNTTAAESATLGSVTTVSTGFALNSTILAAINVSAGTYIFLAIA